MAAQRVRLVVRRLRRTDGRYHVRVPTPSDPHDFQRFVAAQDGV